MQIYRFDNIHWLIGQDIVDRFNTMFEAEWFDKNKNLDRDSYIWDIGVEVFNQLNKFYSMYPITNKSYLGIDMKVDSYLSSRRVVTLRKKTAEEMEKSQARVPYPYCSADVNKMLPSHADHSVHIKKVIFNDPATIVFWHDGSKTVVKAENETFDPEKGLAMAICKKALGNQGNYYDVFRKWLSKEEDTYTGCCPLWLRGFSEKYGL